MLSQSYEVIFPLVLDDFDTLYPLLTIDNWYPFSNYELSDANFDSEHFLNGLKFIETLGQHHLGHKESHQRSQSFRLAV